jgi:hypothetical protein
LLKEFLEEVVGIFVQWSTSCGDSWRRLVHRS